MIESTTINQIRRSPIAERIQFIEIILQSLKSDINEEHVNRKSRSKPFKVRKFSLGKEVHVDRDELYSERI